MARIKATCTNCEKTTLLFIDPRDSDSEKILNLVNGEAFEHECPRCEHRTVLTVNE